MIVTRLAPDLRDLYLEYLGVDSAGPPSADHLRVVQRALLDRVPYENFEIQLGRPTTIDPRDSVRRIMTGRGGYCFHLNGTLAALLTSLGYDVTLTRAAVPNGNDETLWGNHVVLLVNLDGTTWIADVGLGDGFRDPIPLRSAVLEQPPFHYRLEHRGDNRWRFDHDKRASVEGFDLDTTPVTMDAFTPVHARLSTHPDSSFVRRLVVQARRADYTLTLRGCVLTRTGHDGRSSVDISTAGAWFDLLADEFGLVFSDADREPLDRLWERTYAAHQEWDRADRP